MGARGHIVIGLRSCTGWSIARILLVALLAGWPVITSTAPATAAMSYTKPAAIQGQSLVIFDGSAVVTASAYRPLTVRLRATAPVPLVTYALYKLDRATFQHLAASYGPIMPAQKAARVWTDQPGTTTFSTTLAGDQPPPVGLYLLVATESEGASARVLISVTRTALTLKRSPTQMFVWATDLRSGRPVSGARVEVFTQPTGISCEGAPCIQSTIPGPSSSAARLVATGATGPDGVFERAVSPDKVDAYAELFAVVHGAVGDLSVASTAWTARLQGDSSPASFAAYFPDISTQPGAWRAYLYSDRPIYRPGQPVHLRGVVRIDNDGTYLLPRAGAPVTITLTDPTGRQVFTVRRHLDAFGTFNADATLDPLASIGQYTVQATSGTVLNASLPVKVAAYRKPEYTVSVAAKGGIRGLSGERDYVQGEPLPVAAQASYYFGAPLAAAQVRWAVVSTNYSFNPPGYQDYQFDDTNHWWWESDGPLQPLVAADASAPYSLKGGSSNKIRAQKQGTTDGQGNALWQAPTTLGSDESSQAFTVEATVVDDSGQEVAQRTVAVVHRALFYLGLRQMPLKGQSPIARPDQRQRIGILALGMDSRTVQAGVPVTITVSRRQWIYRWTRDASGNQGYQTSYDDTPVMTTTITTAHDGTGAFTFVPTQAGEYHVEVTSHDWMGHSVRSGLDVWVSTWGDEWATWGTRTDDGVTVIPDRTSYAPGDVANLLVNAPAPGMTALVTVERGTVREYHVVALKGAGDVIPVALNTQDAPNVFVGVTLVRGAGTTGGPPIWRQGYVALRVVDTHTQLAVTVHSDHTVYKPRQQATLTVTAHDGTGRPVRATLSLAVVDAAALALTTQNTNGIIPAFYFTRPLAVSTAGTLVQLAEQLPLGQPWWWCRFCLQPVYIECGLGSRAKRWDRTCSCPSSASCQCATGRPVGTDATHGFPRHGGVAALGGD